MKGHQWTHDVEKKHAKCFGADSLRGQERPFRDYSGFGILPAIPSPGLLFRVVWAIEREA
jgi:hypothetical protein